MENEIILRTPSLWKKSWICACVLQTSSNRENGGDMQPPVLYFKKNAILFLVLTTKNPQANCYLKTLSDHCTFKM